MLTLGNGTQLTVMGRRAEQYRDVARDCFTLVKMVSADEARKILLEMAREWQRLADVARARH